MSSTMQQPHKTAAAPCLMPFRHTSILSPSTRRLSPGHDPSEDSLAHLFNYWHQGASPNSPIPATLHSGVAIHSAPPCPCLFLCTVTITPHVTPHVLYGLTLILGILQPRLSLFQLHSEFSTVLTFKISLPFPGAAHPCPRSSKPRCPVPLQQPDPTAAQPAQRPHHARNKTMS